MNEKPNRLVVEQEIMNRGGKSARDFVVVSEKELLGLVSPFLLVPISKLYKLLVITVSFILINPIQSNFSQSSSPGNPNSS